MLHSWGGFFFWMISYPSNCYPISFRYGLYDSSKSDPPLPSILIKKIDSDLVAYNENKALIIRVIIHIPIYVASNASGEKIYIVDIKHSYRK